MALFKKHSLQLSELLRLIPEKIFVQTYQDTQVVYYAKLHIISRPYRQLCGLFVNNLYVLLRCAQHLAFTCE
jgi:hypothetical protein